MIFALGLPLYLPFCLSKMTSAPSGESEEKLNPIIVEARKSVLRDRLRENLEGYEICIPDYENQGTLDIVKEDNEWTLRFYRSVMREYAREVRRRGGVTYTYMIRLQDYLTWLRVHGYANSDAARKQYVKALHEQKRG